MTTKRVLIATILSLLFVALVLGSAGRYAGKRLNKYRPYGAKPLPVHRDLRAFEQRLEQAVQASARLELSILGELVYGDFSAPLWWVFAAGDDASQFRVLITGGVHGDEPAGAEAALQWIETLAQNRSAWKGIHFDILPLVNPWGWAHNRRRTATGLDINRDFAGFDGQESRLIHRFITGRRYDLVVDLHEDDGARGLYLYNIATPHFPLLRQIIGAHRTAGVPIENHVWMAFLRTNDGVIDAPLWSLYLPQAARQQSLINWLRLHGYANAFLIETPESAPLADRVKMQRDTLRMLTDALVNGWQSIERKTALPKPLTP